MTMVLLAMLASAPDAGPAESLTHFTFQKGQTHALPGGRSITFVGHGHKRVKSGGPSSPLIVWLKYRSAEGTAQDAEARLKPKDGVNSWTWDHLRFVLEDHTYDFSMTLAVSVEK